MGIFKLLYEEPEKIHYLIMNLFKLLLTILIVHLIIDIPELKNINSINSLNENITTEHLLFILVIFITSWFVIWNLIYSLLIIIITFFKKNKDNKLNRQDLKEMLKYAKIYKTTEKGYIKPTKHIKIVAALMEVIKDDDEINLYHTSYVEWLFISIVLWAYLMRVSIYSTSTLTWFIVSACIILIGILFLRFFDKLFESLKDNSIEVHNFLQTLLFRKMFINTIENNFRGKLNSKESHYNIRNISQEYKIRDFAFFNNDIGNIALKKQLTNDHLELTENTIIVSNIVPNNELVTIIESLNIAGYISASNEEELLVRLVLLLDALE